MSVASSSLVSPSRTNSLMVRLAPYLVEALCELARAVRDKTHAQTEVSGLLFGSSGDGVVAVEALKTFKDSGPGSDLARRERMEKAFESTMAQANGDAEFSAFRLLGWFSLRGSGGLISSDVEFHNRHFKNLDEISLVVWREGDTQVTAELYARSEGGKLTSEDYRWSSVRLSTELRRVSQPVDLVMRLRLNEDSYLRTYATSERNERREEWKKIAATAKRTMLSLLPGRGRPDQYTGGNLDQPAASNGVSAKRPFDSRTLFRHTEHQPLLPPERPAPALTVASSLRGSVTVPPPAEITKAVAPFEGGRIAKQPAFPEISGLPMVINRKPPAKAVPWLSMALVFMLFSGVTFAVLALKGIGSGSGKLSQIMQVLFPGTDLELRAEGRGDRLLLTWNRKNAMVASASTAVLAISDGTQRFEKRLDAAQIADGSVLYKPLSGDVTFRLQVVGADQGIAVASLRVLDATNPASHDGPILDLSNPGAATPPAPTAAQTTPPPLETRVPGATAEMPAGNRTSANQVVPTLPVANRTAIPHYSAPSVTKPVPEATTTVFRQAREVPKPVVPAPSATQQQQQQQPSQQPEQTAAQQPSTQAPAVPKPAPPQQQQPAARTPATTPQTSGTEIKGWDPNISESKAPAAATQTEAQQQTAAADSKAVVFIGPKVLLQVMPNTRNLTPGSITQTTRVEVEVRVDNSGHVKAAHLLNNNVKNQLGAAAVAAAKQWTFQPATLRGQKVESDHTIVFEFRPEGQ